MAFFLNKFLLLFFIISGEHSQTTFSDYETELNLTNYLLINYNKKARPLGTLTIHLAIEFQKLVDIDESDQTMTSTFHMRQIWFDTRLKWNESEFGIKNVLIPAQDIWTPDTAIMNAANSNGFSIATTNVAVNSNGLIFMSSPVYAVKTTCWVNVKKFPFDTQKCPIVIASWTYAANRILFNPKSIILNVQVMASNSHWIVFNSSTRELLTPPKNLLERVFHQNIELSFEFRRRATYVVLNCILPCVMLNFVTIYSYLQPFYIKMSISKCEYKFKNLESYIFIFLSIDVFGFIWN